MENSVAVVDGDKMQERGMPVTGSLTPRTFRSFLEDCRWQPPWRNMADKCVDYYDGNQLDPETLDALDRKGMGPLIRNITAPLVNVVLGMEAKTRTDWRVVADTDVLQEVAEAQSAKLHEVERESRADRAQSDAYAGQVKAGLGWVEVSRNADPFQYPYRAAYIHRREIWWDWRDDSPDLHKARYLIRKRWFDVDQACAYFPEHRELLYATVGDPMRYDLVVNKRALDLGMTLEEARGLDIEDIEQWRSFDRHRICLYEVWYRIFVRGFVATMPSGDVIEIDPQNPVHLALLNRGAIQARRAVYSKLRTALYAGPHKLVDMAYAKRHLPYVPFWGYREDRTGVPYGLIRAMLSPQDEVNARLQKMMWLLGAKRVQMDSDSLDSEYMSTSDMLAELSRPDAVVMLNPKRMNRADGFSVNDNLTLADAQFKVLQDAMMASQQVVGIFNAMLGRDSSTTANSALQTLVDQGTTALAEINDNQRFARRTVGERLLDEIRDDMMGQRVDIAAGEPGRRRLISLNVPEKQTDPKTQAVVQIMKNDVRAAKCRVALDDIPSSPAYREQQFTMIAELTKGLPPQIQAIMTPFVIEASDLVRRREMADTIRKAMGMPTPKTPEEERQAEAAQVQAAQFQAEIAKRTAMAEIAEQEAKVQQLQAQAKKALAEAQNIGAGDGGAGALKARAQFEEQVRSIEAQSKDAIDQLTADKMSLQIQASSRETVLLNKLSETVNALKRNSADAAAVTEKARIEKDIAEINAKAEVEVARIQADSQKVIDTMAGRIEQLQADLKAAVANLKVDADKRDAKEEKRRLAEDAKEAKAEAQRVAKDAKDDKASKSATPAGPQVVVVSGAQGEKALGEMSQGIKQVVQEISGLRAEGKKKGGKRNVNVTVGGEKFSVTVDPGTDKK